MQPSKEQDVHLLFISRVCPVLSTTDITLIVQISLIVCCISYISRSPNKLMYINILCSCNVPVYTRDSSSTRMWLCACVSGELDLVEPSATLRSQSQWNLAVLWRDCVCFTADSYWSYPCIRKSKKTSPSAITLFIAVPFLSLDDPLGIYSAAGNFSDWAPKVSPAALRSAFRNFHETFPRSSALCLLREK